MVGSPEAPGQGFPGKGQREVIESGKTGFPRVATDMVPRIESRGEVLTVRIVGRIDRDFDSTLRTYCTVAPVTLAEVRVDLERAHRLESWSLDVLLQLRIDLVHRSVALKIINCAQELTRILDPTHLRKIVESEGSGPPPF